MWRIGFLRSASSYHRNENCRAEGGLYPGRTKPPPHPRLRPAGSRHFPGRTPTAQTGIRRPAGASLAAPDVAGRTVGSIPLERTTANRTDDTSLAWQTAADRTVCGILADRSETNSHTGLALAADNQHFSYNCSPNAEITSKFHFQS